ncbi:MAG TPA: preprotein translocase subunit SecE [Deltaproteobacteria bacterium]|nr:preprotein translocase subunit SecE [Deltaproteobacteria bacterium]
MEKIDKAKQFFSEARAELKKVTWPTREQTMNATWVVIVMVIVVSLFLGLVDFLLSTLVRYILS